MDKRIFILSSVVNSPNPPRGNDCMVVEVKAWAVSNVLWLVSELVVRFYQCSQRDWCSSLFIILLLTAFCGRCSWKRIGWVQCVTSKYLPNVKSAENTGRTLFVSFWRKKRIRIFQLLIRQGRKKGQKKKFKKNEGRETGGERKMKIGNKGKSLGEL